MTRPSWQAIHGPVRRAAFYYIFFVTICLQADFLAVALVGGDFRYFDPTRMAWLHTAIVPVALVSWRMWSERHSLERWRLDPWSSWAALGLGMFGIWAGSYFLVGQLTDPSRARVFHYALDQWIPFRPVWVLIYLCVYPMFLVPFFRATRVATLHRLVVGYLVMFAISYTIFLSMPVTFDRLVLPDPALNFQQWALKIVQGQDPPWNCLPSTHCAVAMLAALALWETDRVVGAWGVATALAIGISTMFTKQHYAVDMVAGFALSVATHLTLRWIWRNPGRVPEPARRILQLDAEADEEAGSGDAGATARP